MNSEPGSKPTQSTNREPPVISSSSGNDVISVSKTLQDAARENSTSQHASTACPKPSVLPAVGVGQLLVVGLLVVAADITIYQGSGGFSGWAAWCLISLIILTLGIGVQRLRSGGWVLVAGCLFLTSAKLVWQGSWGLVCIFVVQLAMWIMLLHGLSLDWSSILRFLLSWIPSGFLTLPSALLTTAGMASGVSRARWIDYGLPIMITTTFAAIFLMANPVATERFVQWISSNFEILIDWLKSLAFEQVLLWSIVTVLGLGALVPKFWEWTRSSFRLTSGSRRQPVVSDSTPVRNDSRLYRPALHTLLSVVILFSIYLIVEFNSMWFREFPKGFHYSGYAHQGAAWLTLALALATVLLSAIFRGGLMDDPRVSRLIRLAQYWSALNFLLAICVYNRLYVYVQFNGMTRMRVVALLGITCVVVGFFLVIRKIQCRKDFGWLIHRQISTVSLFVYTLALLPVDSWVYRYNCRKILAGDEAPAVQITEHILSPSAYNAILPLLESSDPVIRDGVAAMLAATQQVKSSSATARTRDVPSWQEYQITTARLENALKNTHASQLQPFLNDVGRRNQAIQRFRDKVYVWY